MNEPYSRNIVIAGTGAAGLYCALNLPRDKNVLLITKSDAESSNSYLAQGGVCVLKDKADYESYFEDTMRAGHYENDPKSVRALISSSKSVIKDLVNRNVDFTHKNGTLAYTREAGHSVPRVVYRQDSTGEAIVSRLLASVRQRPNIEILEHACMTDILSDGTQCVGIFVEDDAGGFPIRADYTVLACGGIGGLFDVSTNYGHMTGDALAIALQHDIRVRDIDYIQIHPTALYSPDSGRRFLISESLRGEGAILCNKNGERFTDEFLPRDKLTAAIFKQMKEDGRPYVLLSLENMAPDEIKRHFAGIYRQCMKEGFDITKEPIPVDPAQHYHMGGIETDTFGRTSLSRLYAIGESACTGVHGANRLASNSLLECLVFGRRAAANIKAAYRVAAYAPLLQLRRRGKSELQEEYKQIVLSEIERTKLYREH